MKSITTMSSFLLFVLTVAGVIIPQQQEGLRFGALLNSSPNRNYFYSHNYLQVQQLGLNSIFQRAVVELPYAYPYPAQESNFSQLLEFPFIVAQNDSAAISTSTARTENMDWIYHFTNALYTRWEAEGCSTFAAGEPVGVKHGWGSQSGSYWRSGDNQQTGKLIFGPNYSQYMKYVYTNKLNSNPFIQYHAVFKIKLGVPVEANLLVCRLIVRTTIGDYEEILRDSIITGAQLNDNQDHEFDLTYSYMNAYEPVQPEDPPIQSPRLTKPFYDPNRKINFEVILLNPADIFVDYVEVYDQDIWYDWFVQQPLQQIEKIVTYSYRFSTLLDKIKYFATITEPHSIDCFKPIHRVQEILDSQGIQADLLTQFYPAWNGQRDGVNIMEKWVEIVQPKKLFWWYYPYWVGDSTN